MSIFKTITFYFALAGILLLVVLVRIITAVAPPSAPLVSPSVNPFEDSIAAAGIVESTDKNIMIGAPEDGLVWQTFVSVGDQVKKGQPLFQLDSRALQAELIVQKAREKTAEAQLARLDDQWRRLQSVQDTRAISQDEVQTKEHDVAIAQAQLQASRAEVKQTEILIERLLVCAPKDGYILQKNIREGEFVARKGPSIILGDVEKMQVRVDIDEQNAGWFDPGSKAIAYPKNNTQIAIPLHFVRIEPYVVPKSSLTGASNEKVDTRVLQVLYSFRQPGGYHLWVGQQVDVFIESKPRKQEEK